jgi:polyhydroxybutyrate depolymerase
VPDDTEFIRRILDDVLAVEYSVDLDRVYVSGFSNGGQMAARLAVELDDRPAAVGAVDVFERFSQAD